MHDPVQQAARAQATLEHQAAKKREHAAWAERRKSELTTGLAALQTRHNALVQDDMALRRSVRDLRTELAGLKRDRDAAAKQLDTVAAELLARVRAFLSQGAEPFTAEHCELAIRYADALTKHARETRLAARPQPDEPRLTDVRFGDPRLTD
jgi:chromosome segregation ATPase